MQQLNHYWYMTINYIEQLAPKQWLLLLVLVVAFGCACMTGLARRRC